MLEALYLDLAARYAPYLAAVVIGILLALIDRRVIGRFALGALLVLAAAGGALGMHLSPFTFHGGDYYFPSLIVMIAALAGLAGYAVAAGVCALLSLKPRGTGK